MKKFEVWKTIQLGTRTSGQLVEAIRHSEQFGIDEDFVEAFKAHPSLIVVCKKVTNVGLVRVAVHELGVTATAPGDVIPRAQVYARAKKHGLGLCTLEMGLQLRLQFPEQDADSWPIIATKEVIPLFDAKGRPWSALLSLVKCVNKQRQDCLRLNVTAFQADTFSPNQEFVFQVRGQNGGTPTRSERP